MRREGEPVVRRHEEPRSAGPGRELDSSARRVLAATASVAALAATAEARGDVERMEADRLDQALRIASGFSASRPLNPRDCHVSLDVIDRHSDTDGAILSELGFGTANALGALAENLERVCEGGLASNLEGYGLLKLVDDARASRTRRGRRLDEDLAEAKRADDER